MSTTDLFSRPDFNAAQRRELASLGLSDIQVQELRDVLDVVRWRLQKPAARNEVKKLLSEVLAASADLTGLLERMAPAIDKAHQGALGILGRTYWLMQTPGDWDLDLTDHLIPRLQSLHEAARLGLHLLPESPTRNKTGAWEPVHVIDQALLLGWLKQNAPAESDVHSYGFAEMLAYGDDELLELQVPADFRASASPGCAFRRIVGICYAAVGGNPDPERALKAYMKNKKVEEKEFEERLETLTMHLTSGWDRTSRK